MQLSIDHFYLYRKEVLMMKKDTLYNVIGDLNWEIGRKNREREIQERGVLHLYGNAALALRYGLNVPTDNVEALIETSLSRRDINEVINTIGRRYHLKQGWFDESVRFRLSRNNWTLLYDNYGHILVKTATPDYIMAMKIVHGSNEDIKIVKELISRIREIKDIKTVMFYINKYYDMSQVDKEVFSQIQKWMS